MVSTERLDERSMVSGKQAMETRRVSTTSGGRGMPGVERLEVVLGVRVRWKVSIVWEPAWLDRVEKEGFCAGVMGVGKQFSGTATLKVW